MANNFDIILDSAFNAYNQAQFDQAEALCREVLMTDASNGDALFLLGLIAYQSGALDPAADLLFKAVKSHPDVPNYTLTLASILYRQGHLDEALRYYEKYPDNPLALSEQGFIYLEKKEPDISRRFFKKALLKSPELPQARLGLALLSQNKKALMKLAMDTNLPDAWYYLARLYCGAGDFSAALGAIDKTGLKQTPYLIQKALIYENLSDYTKALELYQEAALKNPHNPDIWTNQANIFKKRGEFAAAENYYKRALAQDADNIPARHNLADLLFHQERLAESLEQYREVLTREPQNTAALYNLAVILDKTHEYAEALGIYFKLLFQGGDFPDIRWRIADSLAALTENNLKLAQDFATGWVKNAPDDVLAKHTLLALSDQKDPDMEAFTTKLFDEFSKTYDDKMKELNNLSLIEIQKILPDRKYAKALDIGCGTGAWGKAYKSHIGNLTGVDLSKNMLDIAKGTKTYNKLVCQESTAYLQKIRTKFDLITLVDVLGYFSDVKDIFSLISEHLTREGLVAFSVETTDKGDVVLAPHGRYLYGISYLENQLQQAHLHVIQKQEVNLRKEGFGYAHGVVILAGLQQNI